MMRLLHFLLPLRMCRRIEVLKKTKNRSELVAKKFASLQKRSNYLRRCGSFGQNAVHGLELFPVGLLMLFRCEVWRVR